MLHLPLPLLLLLLLLLLGFEVCEGYSHKSRLVMKSSSSSSYAETSAGASFAKAIVSSLTSLSNLVRSGTSAKRPSRVYLKEKLSLDEVKKGIQEDFERGYLFSGAIDPEIYASSCRFTDPTLSFEGLDTFIENIKSVQPLLNKFLNNPIIILYQISSNTSSISTRWRMSAGINLFWKPRIDLSGQTSFTLDSESNRIIDYFETWNAPALDTLIALLKTSSFTPPLQLIPASLQSNKTVNGGQALLSLSLPKLKEELVALCLKEKESSKHHLIAEKVNLIEFIDSLGKLPSSLRLDTLVGTRWRQIYVQGEVEGMNGGPEEEHYFPENSNEYEATSNFPHFKSVGSLAPNIITTKAFRTASGFNNSVMIVDEKSLFRLGTRVLFEVPMSARKKFFFNVWKVVFQGDKNISANSIIAGLTLCVLLHIYNGG